MKRDSYLRILDANLNRSREGLRVCEDICRFVAENEKSSRRLKALRHAVTEAFKSSKISAGELLKNRDSANDVGRKFSKLENSKKTSLDLFLANMERVKEALRTLEEVSKLENTALSKKFKGIRFHAYTAEKRIALELEALCRDGEHFDKRRGKNINRGH